ncbi:MAG: SEC59/DGK1/VTE5 family protein [Victivallaceae bacterium]|nr:SEC59/DGK1/VTE5 family protein [Victivallaceae bacterium]
MTDASGISYRDEVRRKFVHLSSLWMPLAIGLFAPYRWWLCLFFGVCCVLNLIVEHEYARNVGWVVRLYNVFFRGMLRKTPHKGQWIVSGGPYVFAAASVALLLFPARATAVAMTVMLLGDTAAALVGRRWGRHVLVNGKSWEGTLAFCVVGMAGAFVAMTLLDFPRGAIDLWAAGSILAAGAAELFEKQLHFDDNFSIPLIVGFGITLGGIC